MSKKQSKGKRRVLTKFAFHYNNMFDFAKRKLEPNGYAKYIQEVSNVSAMLEQLLETDDFELGLEAIKFSQRFDLEYLAQTAREKENIQTDIINIGMAETHFHCLRDYPDIYKNHLAPGFIPRDRKENGLIPNDGMQKALTSHLKHVGSRESPMLQAEEKKLLSVRLLLTQKMRAEYSSRQRALLKDNQA